MEDSGVDDDRIYELKKYKKKGLIKEILSLEDEIERLNIQLSEDRVLTIVDNVNSVMTEFLKKRIRVVQDPYKKRIYMMDY